MKNNRENTELVERTAYLINDFKAVVDGFRVEPEELDKREYVRLLGLALDIRKYYYEYLGYNKIKGLDAALELAQEEHNLIVHFGIRKMKAAALLEILNGYLALIRTQI